MGAVHLHGLVGAHLAGQRQRLLRWVDDDHLGRRVGLQALDADMPEAAGADDHHARARAQYRDRLLDGVDRGEAGIGERGDVLGLEAGAELDHRARGGLQQVGEPTVAVDTRERAVEAVHVVADAAGQAQAAGDVGMDDDGVADLDVADARADLVHPARVLMTGGVGQLHAGLLGPLALLDVQVGATQAGSPDPHDHVERTVDLRLVDRVKRQGIVVSVEPRGLHLPTSCVSGSRLWRKASSERQMPPLASRLVRTRRPARSHRVS